MSITLASSSAIRAKLLSAAGVSFTVARPDVDETAIIKRLLDEHAPVDALPGILARKKAMSVNPEKGVLVIGADQVLEFEGAAFEKPSSMTEAGERLLAMQGRTHRLINAVVAVRDGQIAFEETGMVSLKMRSLSANDVAAYLAEAGEEILTSVGAYQIEGLGARLLERIDGDYFTVLGLNLLPLIGFLRAEGELAY
ncbi:MAG: hypothetical protein GC152_01785 [Alphaproteobacteria bacterium]|nr:hypothetical protein [Alphaproteobacteria bacterium]